MVLVRHPSRWLRAHPFAADSMLAALFVTLSVFVAATVSPGAGQREIGALGWFLVATTSLPLAWRRIYPVAALWATLALNMPYWVLDYPDEPVGPNLLIAIYSVAAHVGRPRSLWHAGATCVIGLGVSIAGVLSPEDDLTLVTVPLNLVAFAAAWVLGDNLQIRRAYLHELEEKAANTEAQRLAEARRAVSEERTRIARELHDVVAHSMSVMVVQAGAARRVIGQDTERAAEALGHIEATGRDSLTEMRRILGVLRNEDEMAELAPAPGLDDFGRLIEQCEEAGLPVDVVIEGSARDLPASLELSAYRIVQESLTNSLKHAGPARATVRLAYKTDALEVKVTDDGRGAAARSDTIGAGQGIVGMRERVEAFGGSLRAGPRAGGGYVVVARFPVSPTT